MPDVAGADKQKGATHHNDSLERHLCKLGVSLKRISVSAFNDDAAKEAFHHSVARALELVATINGIVFESSSVAEAVEELEVRVDSIKHQAAKSNYESAKKAAITAYDHLQDMLGAVRS